MLEGENCDLIC